MRIKLMLLLLAPWTVLHSQTVEQKDNSTFRKNQIGIHFSPLLNADNKYMAKSYMISHGHKVTRSITIGSEISAFFYNQDIEYTKNFNDHYTISFGLFGKYLFLPNKKLQPFVEVQPFYNFYYPKDHEEIPNSDPGLNAAPGISFFSKNTRFSLDLYYRLSTITNINGKNGAFSYKFNFNF